MRLIDADALLDKQESLYMKGNVLFHGVTACTIENAPTIAPETLPIGRCKDCKYKKNISSSVYCDLDECARNENNFCSEFEPKENVNEH